MTAARDDDIVVGMTTRESTMSQDWDIRADGRAWTESEAMSRYALVPEKIEMIQGKLLWDDHERLMLLGLLLENVGADAAIRLGEPAVWRAAIAQLK